MNISAIRELDFEELTAVSGGDGTIVDKDGQVVTEITVVGPTKAQRDANLHPFGTFLLQAAEGIFVGAVVIGAGVAIAAAAPAIGLTAGAIVAGETAADIAAGVALAGEAVAGSGAARVTFGGLGAAAATATVGMGDLLIR